MVSHNKINLFLKFSDTFTVSNFLWCWEYLVFFLEIVLTLCCSSNCIITGWFCSYKAIRKFSCTITYFFNFWFFWGHWFLRSYWFFWSNWLFWFTIRKWLEQLNFCSTTKSCDTWQNFKFYLIGFNCCKINRFFFSIIFPSSWCNFNHLTIFLSIDFIRCHDSVTTTWTWKISQTIDFFRSIQIHSNGIWSLMSSPFRMPEGVWIIVKGFFDWSFCFCSWCFLTSCRNCEVICWNQTWVYKCFIWQLCTMQDSLEATDCFKWKYQAIVSQARVSWICNTLNFFTIYINFCFLWFRNNRDLITFILL